MFVTRRQNALNIEFQEIIENAVKAMEGSLEKRLTKREHYVVVMFPTDLTPDKVGEMFTLGAHDCVDKPYESNKLLELVKVSFRRNLQLICLKANDQIKNRPWF